MFMGILHGPYLEKLIGSTSAGFSDLMVSCERIESCLKIVKIQDTTGVVNGAKKSQSEFQKKKEGGTNVATTTKGKAETYQMPYYQVAAITSNPYQHPTYVIPTVPPPMQYQQPYALQQKILISRGNRN